MSPSAAVVMPAGVDGCTREGDRPTCIRVVRRIAGLLLWLGVAWIVSMMMHSTSAGAATPKTAPRPTATHALGLLNSTLDAPVATTEHILAELPAVGSATAGRLEHGRPVTAAPALRRAVDRARTRVVDPASATLVVPLAHQVVTILSRPAVTQGVHPIDAALAPVTEPVTALLPSVTIALNPITTVIDPITGTGPITGINPISPPTAHPIGLSGAGSTSETTARPGVAGPAARWVSAETAVPAPAVTTAGSSLTAASQHRATPDAPLTPNAPRSPSPAPDPTPSAPGAAGSGAAPLSAIPATAPAANTVWRGIVVSSERHRAFGPILDDRSFSPD